MRIYPIILLLLINIVLLNSCSTTKHYKAVSHSNIQLQPVLNATYNTALYKASIDIGDKHFSGLFYFKKLPNEEYRILFLSEIGLNLLELKYSHGLFEVINCQKFLNRKSLLNTLQNDLELLIATPANGSRLKYFKHKSNPRVLIKLKANSKRCYYFYSQNNELDQIIKKKTFSKVNIQTNGNRQHMPELIEIQHNRVKLNIKLKLLKVK